jgi:uncharacterized protein YkwD
LSTWLATAAVLLAAIVLALLPPPAGADPLGAANWSRLQGCGAAGGNSPLINNAKLQLAAKHLADGAGLQQAVAASGYLAANSTAIHLSGPASDADTERLIAAHYCATVRDPALRDFGAERRGREVWMILATPLVLPAARDELAVAQRIVELVNAARAAGRRCGSKAFAPSGPLQFDAALTRAALDHSQDMAAHDEFDHRGHDGSTPASRIERAGFEKMSIVGENIAAGATSAAEVTQGWLESPGHCENIMDGRFTHIGIAFAENLRTSALIFWTQDFAAHR